MDYLSRHRETIKGGWSLGRAWGVAATTVARTARAAAWGRGGALSPLAPIRCAETSTAYS